MCKVKHYWNTFSHCEEGKISIWSLQGPKSPFHKLDIRAPIRQQLANAVILEYPQIHVFLPSQSYDFHVIEDANLSHHQPEVKDSFTNDHPSPKGNSFREEEIEEYGIVSDSQVLDLMQHVKSTPANKSQSSPQKEPGENMDFDFEQGLQDVYSDIIAQINPDDFFDWEGDFPKEVKSEERIDCLDFGGVFSVEELEEGEISGCWRLNIHCWVQSFVHEKDF